MTTTERARIRGAGIICACVIALLSMALSLRAISTQSAVAKREAAKAVASVATQQVELTAAQQRGFASDCRILAINLPKPGDPPPSTALGRTRALQYEAEYRNRGCPTP